MRITGKILRFAGAVGAMAALAIAGLLASQSRAAGSAPTFVQQVSAHSSEVSSLALTPGATIATGDRLVVVVGVWSSSGATASGVTDAAGNTYTEVLRFAASESTEMSVWTAPITAGGGTRPAITVKASAKADVGAAVSEYAGASTAAGSAAIDQTAHATGTTSAAATVSSGATAPTSAANELAIGLYVDSGFGGSLKAGTGYTQRSNVSGASDIDLLAEDQALGAAGATPGATVATSAKTVWLMATVVLRGAAGSAPTAPAAPTAVSAMPGDASAVVSWTAPSNGGSTITRYTVTPYIGSTAQTPTVVNGSNPPTSVTVTGLTNNTAYTFTVTATNGVGTGPPSQASSAVTPTAAGGGTWGPVMSWPMVAIHSILLYNGKVLQFDGWQQPEPTQVWDPASQTFSTQTAPDSIFCSGMAQLPDGRILVVGGYGALSTGKLGIVDTTIFDPATQTWSRVGDMHNPRWYPDLTELADGRYVAISGNSTDAQTWADTPEVYDPTTNQWTVLTGVSTSQVHEEEYPFSYLEPNGDVFTIGPSEDKSFQLNVGARTWTPIGGSSGVVNGSSVMYLPGQILYSGGAADLNSSTPASATTAVINLNNATPQWQQVAPMGHARIYHTLTMLADGTVLAVGGEPTAGQTGPSEVSDGILPSEIWNPTTQTWSPAAPTGATRGYHSTAVLMPDGTVLVGGSGHANPGLAGQDSSQIYSPAYLSQGLRPTITSAPGAASYGSSFTVSTPDAASIKAVNLVSLGSDTHQSDMSQHFVPLSFTRGSGSLTVQAPASGAYAPPAFYMLFLVNSAGVPSVASIIQVGAQPQAPSAPAGVSASPLSGGAAVSWSAPANGSPIQSYTVTPHLGGTALSPTVVNGPNPPTNTIVSGLTNGSSYTFTVTATNATGTGPPSAPSAAVTPTASPAPAAVQHASAHSPGVTSLSATLAGSLGAGNRLVVETGSWSSGGATVKTVTDSAGDTFTELLHGLAGDGTEMTVWSAPVSAGAGASPKITATATAKTDLGIAAVEYAGLSSAAGTAVVDHTADAVGKTSAAQTVSSGATPATAAANELAIGAYADSGFGDTLSPGAGFTSQVNVSPAGDMELVMEDQVLGAGATPAASVSTGASTYWQMATLVLKGGSGAGAMAAQLQSSAQQLAPAGGSAAQAAASPRVGATAAASAQVGAMAAAASPQVGAMAAASSRARATAAASRPVGGRRLRSRAARWARRIASVRSRRAYACVTHADRRSRYCRSLRRAAAITKVDRWRFIYHALLKGLSPSLLCHHIGQEITGIASLSSRWYAGR
jgi:hypothetical protein